MAPKWFGHWTTCAGLIPGVNKWGNKRLIYRTGTARHTITSNTDAQVYEKSPLNIMTLKVSQGHRKLWRFGPTRFIVEPVRQVNFLFLWFWDDDMPTWLLAICCFVTFVVFFVTKWTKTCVIFLSESVTSFRRRGRWTAAINYWTMAHEYFC